jgi:hypothetical protein
MRSDENVRYVSMLQRRNPFRRCAFLFGGGSRGSLRAAFSALSGSLLPASRRPAKDPGPMGVNHCRCSCFHPAAYARLHGSNEVGTPRSPSSSRSRTIGRARARSPPPQFSNGQPLSRFPSEYVLARPEERTREHTPMAPRPGRDALARLPRLELRQWGGPAFHGDHELEVVGRCSPNFDRIAHVAHAHAGLLRQRAPDLRRRLVASAIERARNGRL